MEKVGLANFSKYAVVDQKFCHLHCLADWTDKKLLFCN